MTMKTKKKKKKQLNWLLSKIPKKNFDTKNNNKIWIELKAIKTVAEKVYIFNVVVAWLTQKQKKIEYEKETTR